MIQQDGVVAKGREKSNSRLGSPVPAADLPFLGVKLRAVSAGSLVRCER